jgi:hypothetical protein
MTTDLRAAIEALPELMQFEQGDGPHIDRVAVLALFDAAPPAPLDVEHADYGALALLDQAILNVDGDGRHDHTGVPCRTCVLLWAPPLAEPRCGAQASGGPCVLPVSHNQGRADVPSNHLAAYGLAPPSDLERLRAAAISTLDAMAMDPCDCMAHRSPPELLRAALAPSQPEPSGIRAEASDG